MHLRVARLTKPHGLKGGMKVELSTDEPDRRFRPGAVLDLQVPEDSPWHGRQLTVRELRWYNGRPVAFFQEITDRTAAETAARAILTIEQDEHQLPSEPDAWYDHQLVGLTAVRGDRVLGEVIRVDHLPAQDLLAIRTPRGSVLLPLVKAFVAGVALTAGTISVTPPGGLFEAADDGSGEDVAPDLLQIEPEPTGDEPEPPELQQQEPRQ